MLYRPKIIILWLIVLACYSILSAAELDVSSLPLPADAIRIMEKTTNLGPSKSIIQTYETSLTGDSVNNFYKKEMVKGGWRQEKGKFFLKDGYLAVIINIPGKSNSGKSRFTLTLSSMPSKEEVMAQRKTTPDKLNFMPVYPGSEQVFLWDTPMGVSGSYETGSSIQDVIFFYKSGMLNYGWNLTQETPVTTEEVDCPSCKKAKENNAAGTSVALPDKMSTSRASLVFRKGNGDSCLIRLYRGNMGLPGSKTASNDTVDLSIPLKTMILVSYNENKRNHP